MEPVDTSGGWPCLIQLRSRHQAAPGRVFGSSASDGRLEFEEPQRALTPGQSAVFYDGDVVVGGGVIAEVEGPARPGEDAGIQG